MSGYNDGTAFKKLTSDKLLKVVALNDVGVRHFDDLVTGATTGTLDDGEAATIGYALQITGVAAIDEKKAARICAQRYPDLPIITTVDVLSHEAIEAALGRDDLANCVCNALKGARMRVLQRQVEWVVDLIGAERAAECTSLPKAARIIQKDTGT